MIQPHGGKLVDRVLTDKKRDAALTGAGRLARLKVDSELVSDLENIATGVRFLVLLTDGCLDCRYDTPTPSNWTE